MRRMVVCLFVILFANAIQAQSPRLSIRAASVEPVDGWQTMRVEHCQGERCTVWVSPTAALTESDIEEAQSEVRSDGYRVVNVVLSNAGASKMRDLTAAQLNKYMVLIVDNKVIWAPRVNGNQQTSMLRLGLTGSTPTGLTQEEADLIMSILRPAQPR